MVVPLTRAIGLAALVLSSWAPLTAAAALWSFQTEPADGRVQAAPGGTVGWGYTIRNDDPLRWLALTSLAADPFLQATPASLFDFPLLAPLASVSVAWGGGGGLYEITWDAGAAVGHAEAGVFVVSADWYDADPLAGGVFIAAAEDLSAGYEARVLPLPSGLALAATALAALAALALTAGRGGPVAPRRPRVAAARVRA